MPKYLLSSHTFMCIVEGYAVFLDLKHDKYVALTNDEATALGAVVRGWPVPAKSSDITRGASACSAEIANRIANRLVAEGLLTECARTGKEANSITLQTANRTLRLPVSAHRPGLTQVAKFIRAWLSATAMLRFWSIERISRHVSRRKARAPNGMTTDLEKVRALIAIYFRLQPLAFSPKDACLRNSLTLIEFLARHALYPTWVFGVRMEPFAAHSWVQEGPVVFNDSVEHVRVYAPIMAI